MNGFEYRGGKLYVENLTVEAVAQQFGTPCFIYSAAAISDNFKRLQQAFGSRRHQIHYAVKANPNLGILGLLSQLGAGFDVVSGGELQRALHVGPANKVVFSGVGKSEAELHLALENKLYSINIESEAELQRIDAIAGAMNTTANVAVRVNPNVDPQTHQYISTGLRENKFGVDSDTALKLYQQIQALPTVNATGIAFHIGSQLTNLSPIKEATDNILQLLDELKHLGIELNHLDLGGGLGIRYADEQPPSFEDYITTLIETVDQTHPNLEISIEPGRSIVGDAGMLITTVEYVKNTADKNFVVVDAAMNDLLRPALYQAWMKISEVDQNTTAAKQTYDVVGPICESSDFLGKDRLLAVAQDSLLAVHTAGAYCSSMGSNYNSRPRPVEVLVDDTNCHVIRKRESFADLIALERTAEIRAK